MTPQDFLDECLRILRYRIVDTRTDLEGYGQRLQLTEAWCRERAAQIATVFISASVPEPSEQTPVGYALAIERPDPDLDDERIR
jgi:hypothetical protein